MEGVQTSGHYEDSTAGRYRSAEEGPDPPWEDLETLVFRSSNISCPFLFSESLLKQK